VSKVNYLSVSEAAASWQVSERSVRNYCALGRVPGSVLDGKTWKIPSSAKKPERKTRTSGGKETLLEVLRREKEAELKGGIYHRLQIDMTYNSNHIEGSRLSEEQTRFIFDTNTLGTSDHAVKVDDIIETVNHFRCVDMVIESAATKLSESFIRQLHFILKSGTSDSRKSWFRTGGYKALENEAGGIETTKPIDVAFEMKALLSEYNSKRTIAFDDILDFHVRFEIIHPFQDGNGRVGRLIMLKECLKLNIVPFVITENLKLFYYRGISNWDCERSWLRDTCLTAQDSMKQILARSGMNGDI
jgi:Uncharacterized conserved protein